MNPTVSIIVIVIGVGLSVLLYYRILKGRSQTNFLLKNGVPALAIVLGVKPTGEHMGRDPQARLTLQVTPADRPPFQAVITNVFNLLDLGSLVPGGTARVRFDPKDISKVVIESFGGGNLGGMLASLNAQQIRAALQIRDRYYQDLRQRGQEAKAKILTINDMNFRVSGISSMFRLTFDVKPVKGESFKAETQVALIDSSRPKYQPGREVYVRFDPANTAQVALVRRVEN